MKYTTTIDWISFTIKNNDEGVSNVLSYLNPSGIMEPTKPKFGYARSARGEAGFEFLSSNPGGIMGSHFIISGSALVNLGNSGKRGIEILELALQQSAKITRIDLAKDAREQSFGFIHLAEAAQTGNFTGTAQKASVVRSSDGGTTVYIGSRSSERFVRVYDKGVESGEGGNWARLEMETKGETAHMVAMALATGGANISNVLCSAVGKMFQIDLPDWKDLLNSDAEYDLPKIEKRSDTEKWIETQVATAVLSHLDKNPDSEAVKRLYAMLRERLG